MCASEKFSAAISHGLWTDACAIANQNKALLTHPRRLLNYTIAALRTRNPNFIDEIAIQVAGRNLPSHIRSAMLEHLVRSGYTELALFVLMSHVSNEDSLTADFHKICEIATQTAPNAALRRAFKKTANLAKKENISSIGTKILENFTQTSWTRPIRRVELSVATSAPQYFVEYMQSFDEHFATRLTEMQPPPLFELADVIVHPNGSITSPGGTVHRYRTGDTVGEAHRNLPNLDKAVYCVSPPNGFYHWFAEWLPSIYWNFTSADSPHAPVLIRNGESFMEQSINLLHDDAAVVLHGPIHIRKLYVREPRQPSPRWIDHYLSGLGLLRSKSQELNGERHGEKIYISRRDAQRRSLHNETELEELLQAQGYDIVQFSKIRLVEQISRVARAKKIVLPHGAALAHLLLAGPDVEVYEIVPAAADPVSASLRAGGRKITLGTNIRHVMRIEEWNPITGFWTLNPTEVADDVAARM